MHRSPITPRRFLFHAFRLAVFAGALAVSSGFAQTQASAAVNSPSAPGDVQKLASFVVEESTAKPFQDGNRDIPRTSNDVQPYTIINQEAIQQELNRDRFPRARVLRVELLCNLQERHRHRLTPVARI